MPDVTFLTFNYGNAGRYANGPGICLLNFVKDLKNLGVKVEVFTKLKSENKDAKNIDDFVAVSKSLRASKIVHHWSGISQNFITYINLAKSAKVFIGPNVLDGSDYQEENNFLKKIKYNKIFVVNENIAKVISTNYKLLTENISVLRVGPDRDLWSPSNIDNGRILWKGNSRHKIKDVNFGHKVAKALPNYDFEFIGYPNPYVYLKHIDKAKSCHMYFSTSISETMGLAVCESWSSGLPSVIHPNIGIGGENYVTGIMTDRNIQSYKKAIEEIMENQELYNKMKIGSINFIEKTFSNVAKNYIKDNLK